MSSLVERLFTRLTGVEPDLDKGIGKEAAQHQPRNFFLYLFANCVGKLADELSSARLILPWLFGSLGVPSLLVAFLVPLREAGVLIPQLWISAYGKRFNTRKWLWSLGAGLSGISLLLVALVSFQTTGWIAGLLILSCLALYSLGRGICSVTAKEVLGKIIAKSVRGRVMGWSSSLSGIAVVVIGLVLAQIENPKASLVASLLLIAGLIWGVAIVLFSRISEPEQRAESGVSIVDALKAQLDLLKEDSDLQHFIWVRGLLMATALVHPFVVLLIQADSGLEALGGLIVMSALASSIASPIWGYLGDMNSPKLMALSSGLTGAICLLVGLIAFYVGSPGFWWLAGAYALLTVTHAGVRLGRKVYLLDLTEPENRGDYTALANTLIGLMMLAAGSIGLVSQVWGPEMTLVVLGIMCFVAAWQSLKLKAVSAN